MKSRLLFITVCIAMSVSVQAQIQQSAGAALDALSFSPRVFPNCQALNGTAGGCYQGLRFGQTTGGIENLGGGDVLRLLMGVQTQTFPIGSPAGGFTFSFNPSLGVPTRSSTGFGPIFGERALTNGRNNVSFSFNFLSLKWKSFNGDNMRQDEGVLWWGDFDYDSAGTAYSGELVANVDTQVATFAITYGLTDELDLGIVIPVVHSRVEGNNQIQDYRLSAEGTPTLLDEFPVQPRFESVGSSTGIGDIIIRGKQNIYSSAGTAFAVAADLRLPTGSYEAMVGIREFQPKVSLIGSVERGRLSPHGNIGFLWGGKKQQDIITLGGEEEIIEFDLWNELSFNGGLDIAAHPRFTFSGDLFGKWLLDAPNYRREEAFGRDILDASGNPVTAPVPTFRFSQFRENIALLYLAVGGKVRVGGNVLLVVSSILPLNDNGLRPQNTLHFGVDYSF